MSASNWWSGTARALMFLDTDPEHRVDVWLLQGSVLAAVDHVLQQLDFERPD